MKTSRYRVQVCSPIQIKNHQTRGLRVFTDPQFQFTLQRQFKTRIQSLSCISKYNWEICFFSPSWPGIKNIFLPPDQLLAQLDSGRSRFIWPGPDSISSTQPSDQNQVPSPQGPLVVEPFTVPRSSEWRGCKFCKFCEFCKFCKFRHSPARDFPAVAGGAFYSSTLWRHHIHMGCHVYPPNIAY